MPDVEFDQLPEPSAALPATASGADLARLTDVTVELTVEVGRTNMSLGETMALGPGSVVTLDRLADKPVDLLVNGRPIARGEVVGAEPVAPSAAVAFTPEALGGEPAALPDAA